MKKSKISLFALLLLPIAAFAQENKVVSGIIKSTDGKTPLAGVEVFVEGTDLEAYTDENGYYEIEVPEDATLTILYDGYQQIEIPIKSTESFDFSLNPLENENKQLEEVVVIG
ncbi:carboxypeptidase-like regulatory domain-containing protein, partial [Empedobacter sp. UBA6745]